MSERINPNQRPSYEQIKEAKLDKAGQAKLEARGKSDVSKSERQSKSSEPKKTVWGVIRGLWSKKSSSSKAVDTKVAGLMKRELAPNARPQDASKTTEDSEKSMPQEPKANINPRRNEGRPVGNRFQNPRNEQYGAMRPLPSPPRNADYKAMSPSAFKKAIDEEAALEKMREQPPTDLPPDLPPELMEDHPELKPSIEPEKAGRPVGRPLPKPGNKIHNQAMSASEIRRGMEKEEAKSLQDKLKESLASFKLEEGGGVEDWDEVDSKAVEGEAPPVVKEETKPLSFLDEIKKGKDLKKAEERKISEEKSSESTDSMKDIMANRRDKMNPDSQVEESDEW